MNRSVVVGIDQGGTKTIVSVCDLEGRILSLVSYSGVDYAILPNKNGGHLLGQACAKALHEAQATVSDVSIAVAGLNSADWDYEYPLRQAELEAATGFQSACITNDSAIAFRGGTDCAYGICINMGTGVNILVKNPQGEAYTLGYFIPDEYQGGLALGRVAVTAVCDAYMGVAPATTLTEALLNFFSLADVPSLLLHQTGGTLQPRLQYCAPQVLRCAAEGDAVALMLIHTLADSLSAYVAAGARKLGVEATALQVVLAGSMWKSGAEQLVSRFRDGVLQRLPCAETVRALREPIAGALLLGLDAVHGHFNDEMGIFAQSCAQFGLYDGK